MAKPGQSTDLNPTLPNAPEHTEVCAVFVVDACGIVVATNASGRRLWSVSGRSMVGVPFVALLGVTGIAVGPELAAEEWRNLKADALDRWTRRLTQPADAPEREVHLHLERSIGGAGSYIVNVQTAERE